MDFNSVIGHEQIKANLKKAIKDNKASHAYLFQGEGGIGKVKLSYIFSKALLCLSSEEEKPCNKCVSCKRFESSTNPDFLHIKPEKGLITKDRIEELQGKMKTRPINSEKKVIIIEEAQQMNQTSTNKLLKTLEEPPTFVHIILTSSNPFRIFPTILSRVQSVNFFPVEEVKVIKLLQEEYGKGEEEARFIARFTKGIIGDSIRYSKDDELFNRREEILKILDSLIKGDKTKVFYSIDFFEVNQERIDEILDIMVYYFRDILIYNKIGRSPLILNKDKLDWISEYLFMDFNRINDIILNIIETKSLVKSNINYKLAIEAMLLSI